MVTGPVAEGTELHGGEHVAALDGFWKFFWIHACIASVGVVDCAATKEKGARTLRA